MKRQFKIGDLVQLPDEASVSDVSHRDVGVVVRYADTWINLMENKDMRWALGVGVRGHHPRRANIWYRRAERYVVLWPARLVNVFGPGLKPYCEEVSDEQAL